jgi:hypothetical protein
MWERLEWHLRGWEHRFVRWLLGVVEELQRWLAAKQRPVARFVIAQQGEDHMAAQGALTGVAQGATGTFHAQALDANGNPASLPAGILPVWTSSDPVNAPVAPTVDGMTATVAVAGTAPVGTVVNLTVSATLADGVVPTSGPVAMPVLASSAVPTPPIEATVASFIITQSN